MKLFGLVSMLILFQIALVGCIASREGTSVSQWPPPSAEVKKSVSLTISAGSFTNWNQRPYIPPNGYCMENPQMHMVTCKDEGSEWAIYSQVQKQIVRAFEEAGLFSQVLTKEGEADLRVSVKFVSRSMEHRGAVMLTACTLLLVPGNVNSHEFVIRTTFHDRDGKVLARFRKVETSQLWVQLFLLFAPMYWAPNGDQTGSAYDMTRAIIVEAREKKII